uniref:Uncharacterized protein n=1 Tax=Clastoptera arizonana TaxID=38151 RepID=A0A1B6CD88_9HEMI
MKKLELVNFVPLTGHFWFRMKGLYSSYRILYQNPLKIFQSKPEQVCSINMTDHLQTAHIMLFTIMVRKLLLIMDQYCLASKITILDSDVLFCGDTRKLRFVKILIHKDIANRKSCNVQTIRDNILIFNDLPVKVSQNLLKKGH